MLTKVASPSPVVAGEVLEFHLVSTNLGGRIADNQAITDAVPAGTTFVSAAMSDGQTCGTLPAAGATGTIRCVWPGQTLAGATRTLVVRVRVNAGLAAERTIANTAVTSSDVNDPNPSNNTATTTTPVVQSADIAVAKSVNQPTPNYGDVVTFTVDRLQSRAERRDGRRRRGRAAGQDSSCERDAGAGHLRPGIGPSGRSATCPSAVRRS